jgi:hypothetical protein
MSIIHRDERVAAVLEGLTSLIVSNSHSIGSEQHMPGADADRSDDLIAMQTKTVSKLRELRQQFEDLVAGVC